MDDETQQEQASPEVQVRIRASFERQGLMRHLGAHIAHIGPGRVHMRVAPRQVSGPRRPLESHPLPRDASIDAQAKTICT